LPFLRFTRDKRGYETTSLVHAVRRQGRSRQRILYWFRTPPGVKVGRPALDEDAIRWIEEHNPDIEFDWQKILEAKPPPPPPPEDSRQRRGRREKTEGRKSAPKAPAPAPPVEPEELSEGAEAADEPAIEAVEQLTHPDSEESEEAPSMPVENALGPEQLIRLRARYSELQARITERGGDPERIEALRLEAEALNPDTWVTEEEVRKGIDAFEPKIRELRAALGLRRRRRSRRGGRRKEQEGKDEG
jgi:hypothetical protein